MKADPSASSINFSRMGAAIQPPVIVDLMARALANPDLLSLAAGFTDNAVLPREPVADIARELCRGVEGDEPLQYGSNQGRQRLRESTCAWLARYPGEREEAFCPERVAITNGSQQALYLAVQVLCEPGDIVLVEQPSYFVCLEMFRGLGIRAVGLPCGPDGAVRIEEIGTALAELVAAGERERVKALYLVSYFGNPSSRSMPEEEKRALAGALREAGFLIPVIEDAAYRELYFQRPAASPSVFGMGEWADFPKLYLGTYTKPFATGLKVGYGHCSDADWLERMLRLKGHQDFGTAHFNQCVVERMLEADRFETLLRPVRRHYAEKAARLDAELEASGLRARGWSWNRPEGGLVFWLRGPEELDLSMDSEFCRRSIDAGVLYVPGDLCFPGKGPRHFARLSFGALASDRFPEAVKRFSEVAKSFF